MDLLGIRLVIEPIRFFFGFPSALSLSVTSLLFAETGQDLRSLRSDSPLVRCLNEFL
jgi:hypothetical protein